MLSLKNVLTVGDIISRGAEAVIYSGKYLDEAIVLKIRYPKKYRHPQLDVDIRTSRTRMEARILQRAHSHGINVPHVLAILSKHAGLVLKRLEGWHLTTMLEHPNHLISLPENELSQMFNTILQLIGMQVGRLHACGIAHGDLTPHNMLIAIKKTPRVHLIDFGLATVTNDPEKFATDLFTFFKTLHVVAKADTTPLFTTFLSSYQKECENLGLDHDPILTQFEDLKQRGRYKIREKGFYEE